MEDENKLEEKKDEKKDEVKSTSKEGKTSNGGNGVSTGLQFLILLVMICIVALQYIQFEKVNDIEKRLNEEGKLASKTEAINVPIENIELFEVVNGGTYNIKSGNADKYLVMTVNLGINTKDKNYKKHAETLKAKIEIIKETVEQIVTTTDLSYFDGGDKEYTVKRRIIDELNNKFETTIVIDVYFSDKMKA